MLEQLQEGTYVIINGVLHTLTALNNIKDLEVEARKEVEAKVKSEMSSEQLVRELGRAGEFFMENNWRYHFVGGDAKKLVMVSPFEGGIMEHKRDGREFKVYIPNGWVGLEMQFSSFPAMTSFWRVLPRKSNETMKEAFTEKQSLFRDVHPHTFTDGKLCGGMNPPTSFDINLVVQMIKDIVVGSKKEKGTSIWDYNADSPAQDINLCTYGKMGYDMHMKGRTDDEIWNEILKAKQDDKDMSEYIDEGERDE